MLLILFDCGNTRTKYRVGTSHGIVLVIWAPCDRALPLRVNRCALTASASRLLVGSDMGENMRKKIRIRINLYTPDTDSGWCQVSRIVSISWPIWSPVIT